MPSLIPAIRLWTSGRDPSGLLAWQDSLGVPRPHILVVEETAPELARKLFGRAERRGNIQRLQRRRAPSTDELWQIALDHIFGIDGGRLAEDEARGRRFHAARWMAGLNCDSWTGRGLSASNLSRFERMGRGVSEPILRLLAKEFGVDYNWLMGGTLRRGVSLERKISAAPAYAPPAIRDRVSNKLTTFFEAASTKKSELPCPTWLQPWIDAIVSLLSLPSGERRLGTIDQRDLMHRLPGHLWHWLDCLLRDPNAEGSPWSRKTDRKAFLSLHLPHIYAALDAGCYIAQRMGPFQGSLDEWMRR